MAELHVPGGATDGASDNPAVHHEESDVNIRAILGFGAVLIVAAVVIHFGVWLLFGILTPPFVVMVPILFRYSRVVWLHLDYVLSVRRHSDEPN